MLGIEFDMIAQAEFQGPPSKRVSPVTSHGLILHAGAGHIPNDVVLEEVRPVHRRNQTVGLGFHVLPEGIVGVGRWACYDPLALVMIYSIAEASLVIILPGDA